VKPEEKNKFIKELQKDKKVVAMVGDGINDAAALASSHIGIALGGGVGAASEVSSIVLMHNHLSQVTNFPFWFASNFLIFPENFFNLLHYFNV
jgi:Cu2+-exporting ATPase